MKLERNVMSPNEKDFKKLLNEEDLFVGKGKGHRDALMQSSFFKSYNISI